MLGVVASHYAATGGGGGGTYSSTVLSLSPLVYWRLGEASGTTATDASGNGRHGFINGGPTMGTTGLLAGDTDTAITFDGSNDYVQIAYDTWVAPANFTISARIKPTSVISGEKVIAARHASGQTSWDFILDGSTLRFRFPAWNALSAPTALVAGTTYSVAATWDGTTRRLYVNGSEVASTTASTPGTSTAKLAIGARSDAFSGGWFIGVLDEFAFFGSALTGTQVADLHTKATT